jgi:hypothetical protein
MLRVTTLRQARNRNYGHLTARGAESFEAKLLNRDLGLGIRDLGFGILEFGDRQPGP